MKFIFRIILFSTFILGPHIQTDAQKVFTDCVMLDNVSKDSIWASYSDESIDYSQFRNNIINTIKTEWEPFVSFLQNDTNNIIINAVMVNRGLVDAVSQWWQTNEDSVNYSSPFWLVTRSAYRVQLIFCDSIIYFTKPIILNNSVYAYPDPNGHNTDYLTSSESTINLSNDFIIAEIKFEIKWLMNMINYELKQDLLNRRW